MSEATGLNLGTEKAAGNRPASCRVPSRRTNGVAVHVVSSDGQLLNPCHPARARELIRKQRAIRIGHQPYTIRLLPPQSDDAETIHGQQECS